MQDKYMSTVRRAVSLINETEISLLRKANVSRQTFYSWKRGERKVQGAALRRWNTVLIAALQERKKRLEEERALAVARIDRDIAECEALQKNLRWMAEEVVHQNLVRKPKEQKNAEGDNE